MGFQGTPMKSQLLSSILAVALLTLTAPAGAVTSAELYQNQAYTFGRFEARVRFAAGDGVISSFFLWKPGSEMAGTFWNELDFEKLGAECRLQTNPLYGQPVVDHSQVVPVEGDLCAEYHTYTFEWTPSYIAYLVDGVELRRDGEDVAAAFAQNAASGMQMHFNIWPGDATFGGNFDEAILPVQQYIAWVQYSSFAAGEFSLQWREELDGSTLPSGWAVGTWSSPKNLSTHQPANVVLSAGVGVLSLTADGAVGFTGAPPPDVDAGALAGSGGSTGMAGGSGATSVGTASGGTASGGPASGGATNGGELATGSAGDSSSQADANGTAMMSAAGTSAAPAPPSTRGSNGAGCHLSASGVRAGWASWLLLVSVVPLAARRSRRWLKKGHAASTHRHADE
jgi:endo-1,3-1,4-beta-glycanase ExoK